ncbi:hypothetical protein GGI20_003982 [Coemansia sp. BCRC 34301]|nr:hypothetical protein GGI20_003982 [Coemansia sp. BCRC 34301]
MSQLNVELAVWNAAANPTRSSVTAVVACENGVACGHADGKIWLYNLNSSEAEAPALTPLHAGKRSDILDLKIQPKCLLAAHQSPIVLLQLGQISSPRNEGYEGTIVSVSADGDVVLWGASDGRCIARIRAPLHGIRPTSICLQTVDYQSAAEDLMFISGEGSVAYVLSYPSLELVYEWNLPHPEWVTAMAVRKRKDHFRSELITCTTDGAVRIWSFDEFALAQQDVFSRAASPVLGNVADAGLGLSGSGSGAESISSDVEGDHLGGPRSSMFCPESTFSHLGDEYAIGGLAISPFNEDEFLAVSPTIVRLFASRDGQLHELLRWKAQRSTGASFAGGNFLSKADIVFWDELGNISSVCSSFAIQGGSAGMHVTRSLHAESTGEVPTCVVASLNRVPVSSESSLGSAMTRDGSQANVLAMHSSNQAKHTLSIICPMPLSSVSGSANRPHLDPEDAKGGPKNWLGRATSFDMGGLWYECLEDMRSGPDITSVLVTNSGSIAVGLNDGALRLMPLPWLLCTPRLRGPGADTNSSESGVLELRGHTSAITALFEWAVPSASSCELCRRRSSAGIEVRPSGGSSDLADTDHFSVRSSSKSTAPRGCAACSPSLLVSASADLTLRIWDMASGECLNTLPAQSAPVVHVCSTLPTKNILWQESGGHQALRALLRSLVLAVGSDNSATLLCMETLERVYVSPPHHEKLIRLALCKNAVGLELCFADETRRVIELDHMLAQRDQQVPIEPPPVYSVSLLAGAAKPVDGGVSRSGHWTGVYLVQASGRSSTRCVCPSALVVEVEVTQLQAAVSRLIPDGANSSQVQQLLDAEARDQPQKCCHGPGASGRSMLQPLRTSLALLSVLCSWGVCAELDEIKIDAFGMQPPPGNVSLAICNKQFGVYSVQFPASAKGGSGWCMSPLLNAQRMLGILTLSRGILQGNEKRAVEIINYYVGKLPSKVGSRFKPLSLLALAQYWQSPNANLQRAARTLILSTIHGAPEKLRRAELFYWSSLLARCPPGIALDAAELNALTIVCIIGNDYSSLLPLTARSMAASMLQTLVTADRVGTRARMVGIELLSRGFSTFKPYMDCQLIIQNLLAVLMTISEDGGSNGGGGGNGGMPAPPTLSLLPTGISSGNTGPLSTSGASTGLGIYRTMSGASLPALASSYGTGVPVSRNLSNQVGNNSDSLLGSGGSRELPRPIPAPSGGERGGSLATTPTNTLSSVARAAMTSSALRAQAQASDGRGQRLAKLGYGTDDEAGSTSSDGKGGTHSPRSRGQGQRISVHRHRSPRTRQSSTGDNGLDGHGSTVSFNLIVLAKSALLRIATADMLLVSRTVIEILQSGNEGSSVRERRGALQLIGLVAQKYPRQVHPHLEGIAAAIVQAIEPKRATARKLLIAAAGAALQGLVRAYPWVSFHTESQCLAVGCIDGRCTTYDLRTATRTAVYDSGAGCPVAAVAISPHGDRVASFTLGNGMLSIWDPSPSALAMFARSLFWSATSELVGSGGGAADSQLSGSVTPSKTMMIPAGPEQPAGHKLQSLSGFASTPFSQPPPPPPQPPQSQSLQPRSPSIMPPSPSSVTSVSASTTSRMSMSAAIASRPPAFDRMAAAPLPPPISFAPNSSPQTSTAFAYAASPTAPLRRGSGMPPEKTPVGRSGVFDEAYSADPYYRRHSVDMGVPIAGSSQYSPPRQRFQQTLPPPQQQQQQQLPPPQLHHHHSLQSHQLQPQLHSQKLSSPHGFGAPVRYATRSGPGSPHPLSFDQTAGGLSPSRSGSDRGLKRPLVDNNDDDDEDGADEFSASPGAYPYDDEDEDDDGGRASPRTGVATADKPYACDQCELSFSRQHNLKSHALTHSTERPFSCPICHTPFRRQHDLKRHMKLHTGEKPHTCTNCGRGFARLDALNRHMRAENFHACNQAAKRARTAAMPPESAHRHLEDPRLKSASAAYLEQRRASTTSQPPGAPPNWSHWTHRPSIAADESMIRRLQERFGNGSAGSGGSSAAYPVTSSQQQLHYSALSPQTSSGGLPPPPRLHPHSHSHPHAPPTNYTSAVDPRAYAPAQQNGASVAATGQPYAGAPPISTSASQRPLKQQPPPQALSRHSHAAGTMPNPASPAPQPRPQPHSPSMTYAHGYDQGWNAGSGVAKPLAVAGLTAGRPAQPYSSHPHMRLPPMELAPPRRHSLAVTSHLERYRSIDATPPPPPPPSNSGDAASASAASLRAHPQPPPHLAHYQLGSSRSQLLAQQMAPLPEGRTTSDNAGGPHLPPASFINYSPSMRPPSSAAQETPGSTPHHLSKSSAARPPSASNGDSPSNVSEYPNMTKSATFAQQPTVPAPPVFRNAASVGSEVAAGTDPKHRYPLHYQSMAADASGPSSRRGSAFINGVIAAASESPVVAPDNTRRASIIALTNPQSETDIRLENAELKRRLDEMEAKYLKEIERLNNAVRELEIEKSLLKSLVSEQRAETMSISPPPQTTNSVTIVKREC